MVIVLHLCLNCLPELILHKVSALACIQDDPVHLVARKQVALIFLCGGTGQAATPEIASDIMGSAVQQTLQSMFGTAADDVPILYGGSVNPDNVASFIDQSPIHGALVGGASLQAEQFVELISRTAAAS